MSTSCLQNKLGERISGVQPTRGPALDFSKTVVLLGIRDEADQRRIVGCPGTLTSYTEAF
jgi:hypothetical protein